MAKLLLVLSIVLLGAAAAGCGSDEAAQAPAPTPTPTQAAEEPQEEPVVHEFEPGHSKAVREYYGEPHTHGDDELGDTEAEFHVPPHPAAGAVGDTIVLTGVNLGIRMRVTVTGVEDPVTAASEPPAGTRYVAVGLRLRNTGTAIFESAITQAYVTYGAGRRARVVPGVKASCSNGFQGLVRIDDSAPARGCLVFAVPASRRPKTLQLALEQVPAAAGGRWRLR